ncbi:response regulator receiver protein [Stanieria cyanosphaera PCC 7437]|uniref:Response regulator receiver protein n=1 Tax=Stanieria cyanosphaera (strain ATCC 29371 / PCC 7437) TaxID=111780 RepID=K9XX98_STAC7|nr:response regulator [Stanieria cyanosphaera]AFZ36297.1 response regulator receiver protein [Stanieria cyanosphaera PCC 7437]
MISGFFTQLKAEKFTGIAKIRTKAINRRNQWKIYFYLGQITWVDGGYHPQRSWRRQFKKYCPQIDFNAINVNSLNSIEHQEYFLLKTLLERQIVELEQIRKLIINKIQEVLFDILQQSHGESLCFEVQSSSVANLTKNNFPMSITLVEIESVIQPSTVLWLEWLRQGLGDCLANSAPIIKNPYQLSQEVPEVVYQNFVRLLNGTNTIRDIAMKMDKDLLKIALSLTLYQKKGLLDFIDVPDLMLPKSKSEPSANSFQAKKILSGNQPLIVCIDDSPQVCQIMEQVITQVNYRFLGIQKALDAIPTLIDTNPNLIFLDIGMPILNGYEVCAQIKKVSKLKDIPVIMLTGSDGVLDRVKAKVVGSVDFINKPINSEEILKTINKFTKEKQPQVSLSIN